MPGISRRGVAMPASPIRKLVPYANDAKNRGIHVYHLNIGQPDIATPRVIFDAIVDYAKTEKVLPYGPSDGLPELKKAVAEYLQGYKLDVVPDDVFITTAGSEAIVFAMMAIADPGDEFIVFEPFYTNYNGFARMADVKLVPVTTSVEAGFHLPSAEEIEEKITERTRGIIMCNPNNPTGTVYSHDEVEMIIEIASKHDLFVLSDEVYREFVFDGRKHTSALSFKSESDRIIVMDSISKRFSACGARIGYIVTKNSELKATLMKFGQARLCPPTIEQVGAVAGYRHMDQFMDDMISEYERRRDVVYEELMKIPGVFTRKPEGAFYTVVRLPVDDAEKFAIFMLKDFDVDGKTTMVAPANGFYASEGRGKDEIRIAYVLEVDQLRDAVRILGEGLKAYNS